VAEKSTYSDTVTLITTIRQIVTGLKIAGTEEGRFALSLMATISLP
jgi:hypothetical protein